jgi:hypothetical protein
MGCPQEEQDVYAMHLDGPEFAQDNMSVYTMLYNYCNHERAVGRREALAWIEPQFDAQDGRAAFASFRTHFEGEGANTQRKDAAFADLKTLHWKSEMVMRFGKFASDLKNAYDIVSVDVQYADEHRIRDLVEKIQPVSKLEK